MFKKIVLIGFLLGGYSSVIWADGHLRHCRKTITKENDSEVRYDVRIRPVGYSAFRGKLFAIDFYRYEKGLSYYFSDRSFVFQADKRVTFSFATDWKTNPNRKYKQVTFSIESGESFFDANPGYSFHLNLQVLETLRKSQKSALRYMVMNCGFGKIRQRSLVTL